jgi:hypothetical protein
MNYEKLYNSLIEKAKTQTTEGYTESHHIVPRCMGGSDSASNLVRLSARQHFLAHWLLFKIHRTSSLAHAWYSMCRIGIGQEERLQNSRSFAYARAARSVIMSNESIGEKNHFYGKRHSDETKRIISEKRKLRKTSDETKKKMSDTRKGVPKSADHKAKIGLAPGNRNKRILKNIVTGECKKISNDEVHLYDPAMWKNPSSLAMAEKPTVICPHCGFESNSELNMKRWHFDNCKKRIQNENQKH